ncbi:F-box/WD repeat-containing protein 4-like [Asterias amurensis]|uniref:F-box/WD repeat-containing protein 4-like n=1 Tax=Asterias amurensis TaxID=7602 RepID=UPI003AB3C119
MAGFLDLPDEVLLYILSLLRISEIGCIAQLSRRLNALIGQDAAWRPISRQLINIQEDKKTRENCGHKIGRRQKSLKEMCRISLNWTRGNKKENLLYKFKTRYLPWLQLDGQQLYLSQGEKVHSFRLHDNGSIYKKPLVSFHGQLNDVTQFVVKKDRLLTAGCDARFLLYNKYTGALLHCYQPDEQRISGLNIMCVDMTDDLIVGGVNDKSITLWRCNCQQPMRSITMSDTVRSLRTSPSQRSFASGSSAVADRQPIKIWDIESGKQIMTIGRNWRHGAGILHMQYESPDTLLSAGYDTIVRMWDLRTNCILPVIELEDPHDYTVYCIQSDGKYLIASGTALWGVARLWDKRMNKTLQSFFVGRGSNSPVYSLQFNTTHMYVALSNSLRALSFTGR